MQVIVQDPFPGIWILHNMSFEFSFALRIGVAIQEGVTEAFHKLEVPVIHLGLRPTANLANRSAHDPLDGSRKFWFKGTSVLANRTNRRNQGEVVVLSRAGARF